jgi:hypothetical protein
LKAKHDLIGLLETQLADVQTQRGAVEDHVRKEQSEGAQAENALAELRANIARLLPDLAQRITPPSQKVLGRH